MSTKDHFKDLSPKMRDKASWLINAGVEDTVRIIREMTGTPEELAALQAAQNAETEGHNRSSRLKPITAAIKRFTKPAPPAAGRDTVLASALITLEKHRDIIIRQEEAFAAASLGSRLQIGLACLKANDAFAVKSDARKGVGGRGKKNSVTRDGVSAESEVGGFEGWLAESAPWLKKPTAYKYMTAVRGLGLDHTAAEKDVAAALKRQLKLGVVTLKALCDAAVEAVGPPPQLPTPPQQGEFDFCKSVLGQYREQSEGVLAIAEQLKAMPDLHKAACARAYATLAALTGSNWAPSDEPDALASVDPDSISL